jgi:hypothetical protein
MEYTFSELRNSSDAARKSRVRSDGLVVEYQKDLLDQSKDGHPRTHWIVSNPSKGTEYSQVVQIRVPVKGGLFALAAPTTKWNLKSLSSALAKAEVRVHCTCPDFYWAGMKYNLGPSGPKKGALAYDMHAGLPHEQRNPQAPVIRDPSGKHTLCKHLIAVMSVLPTNASSIMSSIRHYTDENRIETNDQLTDEMDRGAAVLDKDINRPQEEEERKISVTEGDKSEMATAFADAITKEKSEGSTEIIEDENKEILDKEEAEPIEKDDLETISTSTTEPETLDVTSPEGAYEIIAEENEEAKEGESNQVVAPEVTVTAKPTQTQPIPATTSTTPNPNDVLGKKPQGMQSLQEKKLDVKDVLA